MKVLILLALSLFSVGAFAQCASTTAELRELVGNSGFALNWIEKGDKNPFTMKISDNGGSLLLKLATKDGEWARMNTRICKKSDTKYVAEVKQVTWGPAAPGIIKGRNVKELGINMPYHSLVKVSISILWKGEFEPN